jgi:hypothetical protein
MSTGWISRGSGATCKSQKLAPCHHIYFDSLSSPPTLRPRERDYLSARTHHFCPNSDGEGHRYVSTWKEFAVNALKTPEVSEKLEREAMAETRNGAAIMVPKLVWVAQKAPTV